METGSGVPTVESGSPARAGFGRWASWGWSLTGARPSGTKGTLDSVVAGWFVPGGATSALSS